MVVSDRTVLADDRHPIVCEAPVCDVAVNRAKGAEGQGEEGEEK
jgi:hypothetical protein